MADASHHLMKSFWGDENFADATVVMGQKTWRLHRLVICKQSKYFEKALEGHFTVSTVAIMLQLKKLLTRRGNSQESKTKTINLMDCDYLEEDVDGLLKYLYTRELNPRQLKHPISTYVIADYFQVTELRDKAANEANKELQKLIVKKYFVHFKDWCHVVLGQFPGTQLEETLIKVIADNIWVVKYQTGAWDELTDAYPRLAKKVLDVLFPKPEPAVGVKRPASIAFDDTLPSARPGLKAHRLRSGSNYYN